MNMIMPDPDDIGKLFVGGLSTTTTKESLQAYFSQFGEVVDSVVMKNNETGRSRGFGFVTYKDPNCVFKALEVTNHELDGKRIDPKECTPRSMQKGKKPDGRCKIFLGGLPPDVTENDIRNGMSKFGKVNQVVIMVDQETKKCRGFGFLSFELEESIDQACAERYVIINGKQIECKKAEPRARPNQVQGFAKNPNNVMKQSPYIQAPPAYPNNWSVPNQPVFNMQGNGYPNYQNYGNVVAVPYNSATVGFNNMQPPAYGQPLQPPNFAAAVNNYYSQISPTSYAQPAYMTNSYTQAMNSVTPAVAQTTLTEAAKLQVQNAALNTQDSSARYARYHPYKV